MYTSRNKNHVHSCFLRKGIQDELNLQLTSRGDKIGHDP